MNNSARPACAQNCTKPCDMSYRHGEAGQQGGSRGVNSWLCKAELKFTLNSESKDAVMCTMKQVVPFFTIDMTLPMIYYTGGREFLVQILILLLLHGLVKLGSSFFEYHNSLCHMVAVTLE